MERKSSASQKPQRSPQTEPAGITSPAAGSTAGSTTGGKSGASAAATPASDTGVVEQAKQTVSQVASQAGEKVTSRLDQQKARAAEGLNSLVQSIRRAADQMREQDRNAAIPQYLNRAVDHVERFSDYLRSTDVRQMVHEVEGFARRRPALFLGGAFALGLIGARFLKSSSQNSSIDQRRALNTGSGSALTSPGTPQLSTGTGNIKNDAPLGGSPSRDRETL